MNKKLLTSVDLLPTSGEETIAKATDLFSWINPNFIEYKTDQPQSKTMPTRVKVYELMEDATFKEIFSSPETMTLTQGQIISFVKEHKDKLHAGGYATFFLFKENDEFFVAAVFVDSDGSRRARVYRFEHGNVWCAGFQHRVVLPKLTPGPLEDPLTPRPLDTSLFARVEGLETQVEKLTAWAKRLVPPEL